MPASIIGAGIGAVGSAVGGISSGKGAAQAAQIQQQTAEQQIALAKQLYAQNTANLQPYMTAGDAASGQVADLLGVGTKTVDPTAALQATPGYAFDMAEGLRSVDANAYANGLGNSGATLQALQKEGMGLADNTYQNYLGNLNTVANQGLNAGSALAGISNQLQNSTNASSSTAANAASSNALAQSANFNNTLSSLLTGLGSSNLLNSSYSVPSMSSGQIGSILSGNTFTTPFSDASTNSLIANSGLPAASLFGGN